MNTKASSNGVKYLYCSIHPNLKIVHAKTFNTLTVEIPWITDLNKIKIYCKHTVMCTAFNEIKKLGKEAFF